MNTSIDNYLSINEILADVLPQLGDEDMRLKSYGFYKALVKRALDELNFDTFFNEVDVDVDKPDNLIIDIPEGCFNLKHIFGIKGTSDKIEFISTLYWKRNWKTKGKNTGGASEVKGYETNDPFYSIDLSHTSAYFFTVQNGKIYLSDGCDDFDFFRITFSGIPSKKLEEAKMIPPEIREAVILFTVNRAAAALRMESPAYRSLWIDTTNLLDEFGYNGAWNKAKQRLREIDYKVRNDLNKYLYYKTV